MENQNLYETTATENSSESRQVQWNQPMPSQQQQSMPVCQSVYQQPQMPVCQSVYQQPQMPVCQPVYQPYPQQQSAFCPQPQPDIIYLISTVVRLQLQQEQLRQQQMQQNQFLQTLLFSRHKKSDAVCDFLMAGGQLFSTLYRS